MLTNPLPDIGADGSSAERCGEGSAFVADGEVLRRVAGVSDDENGFACGGLEGDVGEGVRIAAGCGSIGINADGAGGDELRDVAEDVVGDEAGDVVAIDGEGAVADGAAAVVGVGAGVGVGGEVPQKNVLAPVTCHADHDTRNGVGNVHAGRPVVVVDGLL